MDLVPIIPDEPSIRREEYSVALTKLIRANDHKIIDTYLRFDANSVHIEIDLKNDKELSDQILAIQELKIKENNIRMNGIDDNTWRSAQEFIERMRERGNEPLRYQGDDNPF